MFNCFLKQRIVKTLMLGLDGTGKTTILFKLKLGETVSTVPTIGFNCEVVKSESGKSNFVIYDVGG